MRLAQHIVIGVVCRRYLQTARTELDVHVTVLDDRNNATHQRNDDLASLQPLVLRVFGIDTHGSIAHDGLGTCGSNHGIVSFLVLVDNVALTADRIGGHRTVHVVFQVIELGVLFLVDNLFGRQGGECLGIPVHHAQSAIDEAFVVQVDKHLDDAL